MPATCRLRINSKDIRANYGDTLVGAALAQWVIIPHDCCSGQCETCRVQVIAGAIDDRGTRVRDTVLACLATVEGDAEIRFEHVPVLTRRRGCITSIRRLSNEVMEVGIRLNKPLELRPGQYVSLKFRGYPARDLTPTLRSDGSCAENELIFHMRHYAGGVVSPLLGTSIHVGHRVRVLGPFGSAFLREGDGPIILVAGGTGWAPIWSLAHAARREQRHRELIVIVGARTVSELYMRNSLDWLVDDGVREIFEVVQGEPDKRSLSGRPTHYLPLLGPEDTVYVAGPPGLVDAVKRKAVIARAPCYADPFLPGSHKAGLFDFLIRKLQTRVITTDGQDLEDLSTRHELLR